MILQNICSDMEYAEQEQIFDNAQKVFIISPPRNASTLLQTLFNLNPHFKIFCEANLHQVHTRYFNNFDRASAICGLSYKKRLKFKKLFYKLNISSKKGLVILMMSNSTFREHAIHGGVIGDKTPILTTPMTDYVEWLSREIPNCHFPCIIKENLTNLIIDWYHRPNGRKDMEHVQQQLHSIISVVERYKCLMENNILHNSYFFRYSNFLRNPENCMNYLYNKIVPNNEFMIKNYSINKYGDRLSEVLNDDGYGYNGFIYQNGQMLPHQTRLLCDIQFKEKEVTPFIRENIEYFKNETNYFERWDAAMNNFPFTEHPIV